MNLACLPTLLDLLPAPLRVGAPDVAGPLAVFPIFGAPGRHEYVSYAEGASRGVSISELPGGASVNDVLLHNPLAVPVLLYEGEEIVGAMQNRTVDGAVLVPAGTKLPVPVSCVEHGRWDGARAAEPFAPSPQTAFPALRSLKSAQMRERLASGLEARADQGAVWKSVRDRLDESGTDSASDAMADAFAGRDERLSELQAAITRRDGQLGAIVAVAGRFVVLDYASRADAFAALHGPLVRGYALDAVHARAKGAAPSLTAAETFLNRALSAVVHPGPTPGLGRALRFEGGTGLELDGELLQAGIYAA